MRVVDAGERERERAFCMDWRLTVYTPAGNGIQTLTKRGEGGGGGGGPVLP